MKLKANRRRHVFLEAAWDKPAVPAMPMAEIELKKLLVPVDFSESSRKAVQFAVSFARLFKAEINLLHVIQELPEMTLALAAGSDSGAMDSHQDAAKHLALWSRAIDKQIPSSARIEEGFPADVIVRAARDQNSDMIIIAAHGGPGLERLLLGGTTRKVMRLAPCPVLVVREREDDLVQMQPLRRKNTRRSIRPGRN